MVTIGSLFSGAGALCELAVAPLLGGRVVWHCEHEPPTRKNPTPSQAAARLLAYRFPDTPNLGDISTVDWASVEPPTVLTGGFPCTDVSTAGQRRGLRPDTRSGLWTQMAYAINELRPELVVIENVRGLTSAGAHSDMEPCPWCLGDGPTRHALRALGAVLGDLADLGYDAAWCGLRAADLGACHARYRIVVVAAPADATGQGWGPRVTVDVGEHVGQADGVRPAQPRRRGGAAADTDSAGRLGQGLPGPQLRIPDGPAAGRDAAFALLPTPRATDDVHGGPNQRGSSGDLMLPSAAAQLLPTPTAARYGNNQSQSAGAAVRPSLDTLAPLLPTPTATNSSGNGHNNRGEPLLPGVATQSTTDWGVYEPAIRRHETWIGRPAPPPTIIGARGGQKLNPALTEWMMGLPEGWVTGVPGLTPNEQLRLCGNGVVPHQIAAGVRYLLPLLTQEHR